MAFSCKRRGFCPSCGARRMVETAAHLVDHVIPRYEPLRRTELLGSESMYYREDIHWNEHGHAVVATLLRPQVAEWL